MLTNTNGFQILVGREHTHERDIMKVLRTSADVYTCEVMGIQERSLTDEESDIARQSTSSASEQFTKNRLPHLEALRAIIASVIREYHVEGKGGLDVGSGATGLMVSQLLPPSSPKGEFTQLELNPAAVEENRKLNPELARNIVVGSYHRIPIRLLDHRQPLELVTGLSSLDNTAYLEGALHEIAGVLAIGGLLIHFQDVRPGEGTGPRELLASGHRAPYNALAVFRGRPPTPGTRVKTEGLDPLTFHVPGEGMTSVVELFRRQIGRALRTLPQWEVLFNDWVTARRLTHGSMNRIYFRTWI